jgi:hypothetical protein
MEIVYTILSYLFSTLFGGGIVLYFTKTLIKVKIKESIKNEYDTKIEKLRGEINKNHTLINSILTSQNQNNIAVQNERINAIKVLWSNYNKIIEEVSKLYFLDFAFKSEDLNKIFSINLEDKSLKNEILKIIDINKINETNIYFKNIENERPFLNDHIWINLLILKQFYFRIIFFYDKNFKKNHFNHWKEDDLIQVLCKKYFNEEELEIIINTEFDNTYKFVQIIEQKILFEINNILEGKIIFNISIDNIKLLTELSILNNKNENTTY